MTSNLTQTLAKLQKQNNSIYNNLVSKNIYFERTTIPDEIDEQEHLKLVVDENVKLKEISEANKPVKSNIMKETNKSNIIKETNKSNIIKETKKKTENDENENDDEPTYNEPIKKFETITNMEEMKRAFFGGDYEEFEKQLNAHKFKLYMVNYKYNSDKDGAPDFSAKNLLKGFVRNFDDYRKYFMICFRCWKNKNKLEYKYNSLWIINTVEPVQNIIGSVCEDFEFEETFDVNSFFKSIKKLQETDEIEYFDDYHCIGESYVH